MILAYKSGLLISTELVAEDNKMWVLRCVDDKSLRVVKKNSKTEKAFTKETSIEDILAYAGGAK